jgi:large subunit ribosomal protein L11
MKENISLILYIKAGQAESGPPLGTILGNIGVQTVKFCKEFNDFTKELPTYFLLKVKIDIAENKTFIFNIQMPSIGYIISLLKKEEKIKKKDGTELVINYIFFEELVKLAKFKFPELNLERSIKIIKGSLYSSKIQIKIC